MLMEKVSTARFDFFRTMENDDVVDVYKTIKWKSIGRIEKKKLAMSYNNADNFNYGDEKYSMIWR